MPNRLPVHPQSEYADLLETCVHPGIEWLDIGCGRQLLPAWAWKPGQQQRILNGVRLAGLDVDKSIDEHPYLTTRLIGVAEKIPAPEAAYDLVTANMVMEHVEEPSIILREVWRVLRNDGRFIVHTPNLRYYLTAIAQFAPQWLKNWVISKVEDRAEADVFPTHYKFNTPEVISRLAQNSGFVVDRVYISGPYPNFWHTRFAILERPVLSLLRREGMLRYRSNLIVTLRKPTPSSS
jgi:SAM-dependent methyltransferase